MSNVITAQGTAPIAVGQVRNITVELADTLRVTCLVVEERRVYGRVEYLVTPIEGEGTAWVRADRIITPE